MAIDFQPLESTNTSEQVSTTGSKTSGIDFQPLQATETSTNTTGKLGAIDAAAMGAVKGITSGIQQMGQLADSILQYTPVGAVSKLYNNKVGNKAIDAVQQEFSPKTDFEKQAVQEHPNFYKGGDISGNVLTQIAGTGPASNAITGVLKAGLTKVAPSLLSNPIAEGALNQGIQGAGLGTINNPDNKTQGALTGATLGAALGGVGGAIGSKLQRSGDILDFEQQNAKQAGIDINSYEGINRAKNAIKNNGVDFAKYNVGKQVTQNVKEQIQPLSPSLINDEMPAETLTRLAGQNYQTVKAEVKAGFAPLSENKTTFTPSSLQSSIDKLSSSKVISKLPDKLSNEATLQQMWEYRQALDDNIRVLSRKAKESVVAMKQVKELGKVREAVTTDLLTSADKAGLKEQFLNTENLYKTKILPYSAFKTDINGDVLSERALNDIMTKFNRFTTAKTSLNINDITAITKTLGPEGQKTMGWALLQKAMSDTSDAKNIVNAKSLFTRVRKYDNMGVFNVLKDPDLKAAVSGIKQIADGADELVRQGAPTDIIQAVSSKIPSLLGTTGGRALLSSFGSSKIPQTKLRGLIRDLLIGSLVIHKTSQEADNSVEPSFNSLDKPLE